MADIYDVGDYLHITHPGNRTRALKLAYYAQAWHLAWHGTPLFREQIQAWKNGPVASELWVYARSTHRPTKPGTLSPTERATLDAVIDHYGHLPGIRLSDNTHQETPWVRARGTLGPEDASTRVIPREYILSWCAQESMAGNAPTYKGPQPPGPTFAELEALDRLVAEENAEILAALADR